MNRSSDRYIRIMQVISIVVFTICLLLAGFVFPSYPAAAQSSLGMYDFQQIEAYITAEMQKAKIPGLAIGIVAGDQVIYLKGFGKADATGRPVTPQTPMLIGSVTKSFTALAVMQLVEAGKIELDAPVQRYLPWFSVADPKASSQIRVRHLLNQTSGIPQTCCYATMDDWEIDSAALERHVRFLETTAINRSPGNSYEYSNANYTTLGMIVQAISGQSYEEYMQAHILSPLEMNHSHLSQEQALLDSMASGYRRWFGLPLPVTLPYNRGDLPAGFLIASAEDMTHFLIAQLNDGQYMGKRLLSSDGMALLRVEPYPGTYGMGMHKGVVGAVQLIGHEGANYNFQSAWFVAPENGWGVFIAANVVNLIEPFSSPMGQSSGRMAQSVIALLAGQPLPDQGTSITKMYLAIDAVILMLTLWLVWSLAQTRKRVNRFLLKKKPGRGRLAWRYVRISLLHFIWPIGILLLATAAPPWKVSALMQPDILYWLEAAAILVLVKGIVEIVLTYRNSHSLAALESER